VRDAYAKGFADGVAQSSPPAQIKRKPGRPRKQPTNGAVTQLPEPVRDSYAVNERVWLVYGG
jgi:hypothetical protein